MDDTLAQTHAIQSALRKKGASVLKKAGRRCKAQKNRRRGNYSATNINKAFDMKFTVCFLFERNNYGTDVKLGYPSGLSVVAIFADTFAQVVFGFSVGNVRERYFIQACGAFINSAKRDGVSVVWM